MKALQTLIKLNKNLLNNILKDINKHEHEKTSLLSRLDELTKQIINETNIYHGSNYSLILQLYLDNAYKKRAGIQAQIDRLQAYIEKKRLVLAEQYSELKKYEIALQVKQKQLYLKALKEETKLLDEFGTNSYIYNK